MNITIGTFNILDPDFAITHNQTEGLAGPKASNWATRSVEIGQVLRRSNLDIVCLQEVSLKSLEDLKATIASLDYEVRIEKHAARHDGVVILYKKNRLEENDFHTLSKHGLNSCFIDLKDKLTGKIVRVANCHLLGGPKSHLGVEQIEALVKAVDSPSFQPIDVSVIVGDFNADAAQLQAPSGSKFKSLKNNHYTFDGNLSPTEPGKGRHIDWIWVRSAERLSSLSIPHPVVSDHTLLATEITFKASALPNNPIPFVYPQPFSDNQALSYKHNQPKGSFRAKIMDHFVVKGWDTALKRTFTAKLDEILSQCASSKPFLPTVRQLFANYVETLFMANEQKTRLLDALEQAILNVNNLKQTPRARSETHSRTSNLNATLTLGQRIGSAINSFFGFLARLFGFR